MNQMATDAHCHLSPKTLASGMKVCADACFVSEWNLLAEVSAPSLKRAFGLHPSAITKNWREDLSKLEKFLPFANAIGEAGLDSRFAEKSCSFELQEEVFKAELSLADKYKLPAIIHCVGAWGKVAEILGNFLKAQNIAVIHAANCSFELARQLENLGAMFSLSPRELKTKKGRTLAGNLQGKSILLESDGDADESIYNEALLMLEEIRDADKEELSLKIFENFERVFK